MPRYYGDYFYLSLSIVVEYLPEEKLLHAIADTAPIWVISETRRADQSEFLSLIIIKANVLSEEVGHEGYERYYIEFKWTMLLYFKPLD
ncbi:MAG: hypothetical protein ACN4GF_11030 [Lentimonas sp.]